jgi:hypothetical protein
MRYTKTQVNGIINEILYIAYKTGLGLENSIHFTRDLELIKEQHLLIDRRKSAIPEYRSEILRDFMEFRMSYKDIMNKYHCSERTVKALLQECAEEDGRVMKEMEFRSR